MLIPPPDSSDSDSILSAFLDYLISQEIEMYPHQEEAILELFQGHNVILNTPTGSGKSLVALAVQFRAIHLNRTSYYTVPIKALANEKFLALCKTLGPENVGLITGDATVNPDAPVVCCTAEIVSNLALREGSAAKIDDLIMDEFHYYSDPDRGIAWQIPLLTLPQSQFLLMSATLGETKPFIDDLSSLTKRESILVQSDDRPVPLHFDYSEETLEEKVETLVHEDKAPIYLVNFTQLACAQTAQNLLSRNFCSKEEKRAIAASLQDAKFNSPYGKELAKVLRHGIGIHHAGLLPKYRLLVEKLAQEGLLKVICGTDTLGVGVNVPIRTVLFTQLCKFDGSSTRILTVRDFKQICGRAGRRGFDDVGYVVAQAPAHAIENIKLEAKAAAGKKKKFVRKKPPERGYVHWDEKSYRKLIEAQPEKLESSFKLNHGLLLNVLSRPDQDGCAELKLLIEACHESAASKKALRQQARSLFMSLVRGEILTITPPAAREDKSKLKLHWDLQEDFSMNQALALFLIDTLPQLDPEAASYPLQVLTLIESILENPSQILRSQERKAKDLKMAEMKEDDASYEERMEALLDVSYPKPDADVVYTFFNEFLLAHPYLEEDQIRPKSIAREMFYDFRNFDDYIREYKLEKSEAILLRHLTEVYKILNQTVPPAAKTEALDQAEDYFGDILRQVDSSLLDEWQKLKSGDAIAGSEATTATPQVETTVPLTRRRHEFERAVRTASFELVKALSQDSPQKLLDQIEPNSPAEVPWTLADIDTYFEAYFAEHHQVRLDPEARNPRHLFIEKTDSQWKVEQVVLDSDALDDWSFKATIDLAKSDTMNRPFIKLISLQPITN